MRTWQSRTAKYFYAITGAVLLAVVIFILVDSFKYRQVRSSLTTYMENLRDMVFMSTYDSLKKGNMKLFKSHLVEIGTLGDVSVFSMQGDKLAPAGEGGVFLCDDYEYYEKATCLGDITRIIELQSPARRFALPAPTRR